MLGDCAMCLAIRAAYSNPEWTYPWNHGRTGLAAWHLPGGPVGPPARWAATSNVEVGQTAYPFNRGREGRESGRGIKSQRR